MDKLDAVSQRYEKAVLHIEDFKAIVAEVTLISPKTNLSYIIQNQARLIKSLPELHGMSMRRYLDKFESSFNEGVLMSKHILENNKCITYLKMQVREYEERSKKIEQECNEDMCLLKLNMRKQMEVLESRMEKLIRKEQLDMLTIIDLKKEVETVKAENEQVVDNLNKGIKDILAYHQMHAQLLASENNLIRNGNREDEAKEMRFTEYTRAVSVELRNGLSRLLGDIRSAKNDVSDQLGIISEVSQSLKAVDLQQRSIIKGEVENFRKGLLNVKDLIMSDNSMIKETIVQLKLYVDQLQRNTDQLAQDFEKQVNRFVELNKMWQKKAQGLAN